MPILRAIGLIAILAGLPHRACQAAAGPKNVWQFSAVGPAATSASPVAGDELRNQFELLDTLISQFHADQRVRDRWGMLAQQALHPQALIFASDRDPLDVVLRRTAALVEHIEAIPAAPDLSDQRARLAELRAACRRVPLSDRPVRRRLFEQVLRLRRCVAFSNPRLDFDAILFIKRHRLPPSMYRGDHMCDQFFGFHAITGGGLFVLERPFGDRPTVRNVLADAVCLNGRFKGKRLQPGAFLSPDLSYDGNTIVFAYTEAEPTRYKWTPRSTYHIFRVNVDGSELTQLTDGPFDDFDPCWLPDGRIVFISERRGGYGRCHPRPVPLYTLHVMNADGSGIRLLSPNEANEWQPSVDHDGRIVYTRWDYVDRGNIQAHHPWVTTPEGRDARSVQGNFGRTKRARPLMELDIRAIPGSLKYVATAAAHHGQAYGSLVVIDPNTIDDDAMGPVKRLTPEVPFPEAEARPGDAQAYATAAPLSEYCYLCVGDAQATTWRKTNYGIYLLDAFGNRELIYRDSAISCLSPIPLRPRPRPPVLAAHREPGPSGGRPLELPPASGLVGLVNVYRSQSAFPPDTRIRALRIIDILPKTTPLVNEPRIGYGNEKGARAVLGTVPVEEDGSACFCLPAGKPVYFQALDEDGMAVQSMRSATYVRAGQRLFCSGCHEPHSATPLATGAMPLAFRRPPSQIEPDVDGTNPFSFPRLVQPVLDRRCAPCHERQPKAIDLRRGNWQTNPHGWYTSYINLRPFAFFYGRTEGKYDPWTEPRTVPGRFGARASKLYQLLKRGHYDVRLSPADLHRLTVWLDSNSSFFGRYRHTEAQSRGEIARYEGAVGANH